MPKIGQKLRSWWKIGAKNEELFKIQKNSSKKNSKIAKQTRKKKPQKKANFAKSRRRKKTPKKNAVAPLKRVG